MFKVTIFKLTVFPLAAIVLFVACRKREGFSLPDNFIVYTTDAQGLSEAENSIAVKVKLTRGTDKDIPVIVNITEFGAQYGIKYTTTPAASANSLKITVPSGNNEASFIVNKVPGVLFDGTEKLVFDIYSSGSPILIGNAKQMTLNFAELVATNSAYMIDGGGPTYPNKVFIDLSANRQTPVVRTNWDLGFYSGDGNDFKVILNASTAMMAKQIDKNDLMQVTSADTAGFSADVAYSPFAPSPTQMPYVDYPDGSLDKTAIGTISATANDNKVFIVNRGSGVGTPAPARGWKKIRVFRNAGGGYTLQHADIASTTFSSIDIARDDKYFFKYVSFESGIVPVEPEKTKWDIAWSYSGFVANFGAEVPYTFQDIVVQNRNVEIAKVLTSAKAYASFSEADIPGLTFSAKQSTIGSDWRRTTPSPAQAWDDRYYIIKDGSNNYYKLRFTALTGNGSRGYPSIEYVLVKRG
jgi:HmuY protein